MCAEPAGSPAQSANRAIAARTHTDCVPDGGSQLSSGAARSSQGRAAEARSDRRGGAAAAAPPCPRIRLPLCPPIAAGRSADLGVAAYQEKNGSPGGDHAPLSFFTVSATVAAI